MQDLTFRRQNTAERREYRGLLVDENAHAALGKLYPGCEIFGFFKGQFSLINLIRAILDQTGPAHLTISTWTAAKKEINDADALLRERRLLSLRFLVDFSFPRRQPQYCAELRAKFGDEALRVTKTHAKFITFRNDRWNIVLRTSANLNTNPRFENFEISDDPRMLDFLNGIVNDIFEQQPVGAGFTRRPGENCHEWQKYGTDPDNVEDASYFGADFDDPQQPGFTLGTPRTSTNPDSHPQFPRIKTRKDPDARARARGHGRRHKAP